LSKTKTATSKFAPKLSSFTKSLFTIPRFIGTGLGATLSIFPFGDSAVDQEKEKIDALFRKVLLEDLGGNLINREPKFTGELPSFIADLPDPPRYPDKPEPDVQDLYEVITNKKDSFEKTNFQKLKETPEYINMIRHVNGCGWSYHPWFPKDRTLIDAVYGFVKDDKEISKFINVGILPIKVPAPYGKPITLYFDSRILMHDLNLRPYALEFLDRMGLRWEVVIFYKDPLVQEFLDPRENVATYSLYPELYPELPTITFKSLAFINRPPETTVELECKAEHGLWNPNNVLVVSPPTINETTIKDLNDMLMWMSDKMVNEKVPAYKMIPHFHAVDKDAPAVWKEKSKIPGFLESIE
jgi:hypothetical protein